jgi:hypothetical protein
MEEWRAELEAAIECGLQDFGDNDSELEEEAFMDAFDRCKQGKRRRNKIQEERGAELKRSN